MAPGTNVWTVGSTVNLRSFTRNWPDTDNLSSVSSSLEHSQNSLCPVETARPKQQGRTVPSPEGVRNAVSQLLKAAMVYLAL